MIDPKDVGEGTALVMLALAQLKMITMIRNNEKRNSNGNGNGTNFPCIAKEALTLWQSENTRQIIEGVQRALAPVVSAQAANIELQNEILRKSIESQSQIQLQIANLGRDILVENRKR